MRITAAIVLLISLIHVKAYRVRENPLRITLRQPPSLGLGTVAGFSKCGGSGKVDDWRAEGCSAWLNPCLVPFNVPVPAELDFVPGDSAGQLGLEYFIYDKFEPGVDINTPLLQQVIDHSAVEKGVPYTLHRVGKVPPKFQGKMITVKLILHNIPDNSTNICAQANYQVKSH